MEGGAGQIQRIDFPSMLETVGQRNLGTIDNTAAPRILTLGNSTNWLVIAQEIREKMPSPHQWAERPLTERMKRLALCQVRERAELTHKFNLRIFTARNEEVPEEQGVE